MSNCSEQDIFVEELIPNHALNKAAEWFNRQKVSKMESETTIIPPKRLLRIFRSAEFVGDLIEGSSSTKNEFAQESLPHSW